MKGPRNAGMLALGAAVALGIGCSDTGGPTRMLEALSPVYHIDREYRSMVGPMSTQKIQFPEKDNRELLWITGYRAEMVAADGRTPMSQEFMCHSNLDFDAGRHGKLMHLPVYHTDRLFTLSQGQYEIELPEGFGLPFYSDEAFDLTTQVLDLNFASQTHDVRHKITIKYARDRDLIEKMRPLFMTSGWGLVLLTGEDGYFNVAQPNEAEHGPSCLPGASAGELRQDAFGREFSGHWVVKPGREVNRTLVTQILKIPYDTTVHYIAVHLHPFAESLELVDLTSGATVFKSNVDGRDDKIGIERVDSFSSKQGLPIYKDHEYEMISVYNNTTSEDQDSMAVMLLYLMDQKFVKSDRPRPPLTRVSGPPRQDDETLVLHTNHGDIEIGLYPDIAPRHVEQIKKLVELKVYDGVRFHRLEPGYLMQVGYVTDRSGPPLSAEQLQAIELLDAEFSDLRHVRGTVSMTLNDNQDPNSGDTSFMILLGDAPMLDESYTVFGQVVAGFDTLDTIAGVPRDGSTPRERVEIRTAEIAR